MDLEHRALPGAEIRSYDDTSHQFTARVLTYNRADTYGTVWSPGVFGDSLAKRMPAVCWSHDMSRPIGRIVEHHDGPDGLDVTVKLADPDAVPDARMAHSMLADGIVDEFSVGFKRAKTLTLPPSQRSAYGDLPAREKITSATLGEVSAVVGASVPGTALLAIRAEHGEDEDAPLDLATIERLHGQKLLDDDEARGLMVRAMPELAEHVRASASGGDGKPFKPAPYTKHADEDVECPNCHKDNDDDARFCDQCGAKLAGNTKVTTDDSGDDSSDDSGDDDSRAVGDLTVGVARALQSIAWNLEQDDHSNAVDLVEAARTATAEMLDILGRDDDLEERKIATSDKPWSSFSQADYTPAQWKNACLIWNGPDDDKSSGSLPVKEPDGTVNTNALSAAAGRLGQVDASSDAKTSAAKKLVSLYNQAGLKPGPGLLKQAGGGVNRSDDGPDVDAQLAEANRILAARLG